MPGSAVKSILSHSTGFRHMALQSPRLQLPAVGIGDARLGQTDQRLQNSRAAFLRFLAIAVLEPGLILLQ